VAEQFGDKKKNVPPSDRDIVRNDVTGEVGSEGGSPGDVELETEIGAGTGSEAGETFEPNATRHPAYRDETGKGRRSP
jgi:hypothetical protein